MKVLAHIDATVLEQELLSRVDATHPAGEIAGTLIVVPTTRLAEHLLRKLSEVRPAWLGLEVLHFRSLAFRILEKSGTTVHTASTHLLEALLRRLLRDRPRNLWSRFVDDRPGALSRLVAAVNDLREAGIEPGDVERIGAGGERGRALAELYRAYHDELERAEGWTDNAGLIRRALSGAAAFGKRSPAVFVHGAYDLIGVHLDLVRALDAATEVTIFLPAQLGTKVSTFSESFAREFLLEGDDSPETPQREAAPAVPLTALYDEESRPEPAATVRFTFRHTQGTAAEVKIAVRQALRAVREGCPPTEIAIAARTLEPYAAAIEEAFEDEGLPCTSSVGSPVRRHPVVRDFLLLLRVLAEGFPRQATATLLRSPHLRWRSIVDRQPWGEQADRWSRQAGIVDGLGPWTEDLPSWVARPTSHAGQSAVEREQAERRAAQREPEARRIALAVRALADAIPLAPAGWAAHQDRLGKALASLLHEPEDEPGRQARDGLRGILEEMGRMERLLGDRREVGFEEMRSWLEEAVDRTEVTLNRRDDGGPRILDAMQLRGLTFRHLHLLGMNGGLFPRPAREDPILTDEMRRALRERTGRPLAIKSRGSDEERLLLAVLLGSARERVEISWQRADESGRAKTPSLALREVARVALGRPDAAAVREAAFHLPSHPTQWLDSVAERTGLLAPREAALSTALHARDASAAGALERQCPELASGLRMLRATQAFAPGCSEYDARIGPPAQADELSVSDFETLGSCPLQFFFKKVLRVRGMDDEPSLLEIPRNELGSLIHVLLEEVYGTLMREGRFGQFADILVERGLELIEEHRPRLLGATGDRLARRLPVLWSQLSERWVATLRSFVREDLQRIRQHGWTPVGLEAMHAETLDLGEGIRQGFRGKFDRRFDGPTGSVVGDYKTSTNLDFRMEPRSMLQGRALQVPLYQMMAGEQSVVELLGVHPDLDPAVELGEHRFEGFQEDRRTSFRETLRSLLRLRNDGSFPLRPGIQCEWCDYQKACRRNHPPTKNREELSDEGRLLERLGRKSTRNLDGR